MDSPHHDDRPPSPGTSYRSATPHPAPAPHDANTIGYTIMACGERTGKTSFLRLLLDTSDIAPSATKEQLASVAKFVQGCSGHTTHIRTVSVDVDVDTEGNGFRRRLALTLIDTPSLDFADEPTSDRLVSETLRHVEARFADNKEDEWTNQNGDHHVHLCIYFLDPDHIIPPSVTGPPGPLVPRARTNSFSQPESEPVILEPPVTTNPLLCRPTLPEAEIKTIRRLSARVNVLPVVARADTLSNDRLQAVKLAIRRDLADAGIGFGIFDMVQVDPRYQQAKDESIPPPVNGDAANGYSHHNGPSLTMASSPPGSPAVSAILRLPYALISPDMYSHSDGVTRIPSSRHELVIQYTPPAHSPPPSKIVKDKFIRSYRWGSLDVLDPNHSDFIPLRAAIFHHMETLQKYTREYLFDKFRLDYHHIQPQSPHHHLSNHIMQSITSRSHPPHLSHASRPTLAIDTAPHAAINRHPSLTAAREAALVGEMQATSISRAVPEIVTPKVKAADASGTRSTRQRTKKITVACNFCRSRKLKCDGGRPACSQCLKRSNPCDYMAQNKRRGTLRQQKDDESESESADDRSADYDEPSLSPEISSQPLSRRSSLVDKLKIDAFPSSMSSYGGSVDRRDDSSSQPSSSRSRPSASSGETRSLFPDNELPHIATLSLPEHSPSTPMSAPSLPPIRPASDLQAAQRKRAATVPGKSTRQSATSGPKVVACNFCRARKTKCDGAHPACSSCARRSLQCNYVHDSGPNGSARKAGRRASTSTSAKTYDTSPTPHSPQSLPRGLPAQAIFSLNSGYIHHNGDIDMDDRQAESKRSLMDSESNRPPKKMRMDSVPVAAGGP